MTFTVNPDPRIKHMVAFYKLIAEINKKDLNHLDHTMAVVKAGIESGMIIGGAIEEVADLKTGEAKRLAKEVVEKYVKELEWVDGPN
jgi:hypothetical protein